ncbi:MAG TPA: DUF2510 domain-containing protein [Solirubrobacterales bacterium]|nr:DUF2510 domain-containing protein [Solirubrobacterales bacterium]
MTDEQGVQPGGWPAPPPPPVAIPADWYPDPDAPETQLRYWDGNRWTDHFSQVETASEAQAQVDPGWYVDPKDPATKRYWDGSQWSEWTDRNYSSKALGGKENPNNDTLAVVGWITAVIIPIVGLVIGIVLNTRDDQRGTWIMVTSAVFIALGLLIVAV